MAPVAAGTVGAPSLGERPDPALKPGAVQQPDGGFVDGHAAEGVKELVGNEGEAGVGPCEGVGIIGSEEGVDGGGGERRRGGILGGGVEVRGWRPLVLA